MPKLIRLYIASILVGFELAVAFVALLLWLDVAGLRHLVLSTEKGWLGGLMLVAFNAIIFAGVQFGIAVMQLASDKDGGLGGGRRLRLPEATQLARAPATRDRS